MLALLLLLPAISDAGIVQHSVSYRLGVQSVEFGWGSPIGEVGKQLTSFAGTLEGTVRITDRFGVEGLVGGLYASTNYLYAESRLRFGNPLLRGVYADRFGDLRLRVGSGFSLPFSSASDELDQGFVDRAGFGSAVIRSGGSELWMWAPRAASWVTSARIEQALDIFHLALDTQSVLMLDPPRKEPRVGASVGGDVAVRPSEELEFGLRVQLAGMITEGNYIKFCFITDRSSCNPVIGVERVLENDVANLSMSSWIATHFFERVTASVRFLVNLTDALGWEVLGGTHWGLETSLGVTL